MVPGPARCAVHDDPGLQPERTSLAWVRTLLSLAAVAFLCLRCLPAPNGPIDAGVVPACALAYAVSALVRVPARRRRSCAAFADERAPTEVRRAVLLVLAVLGMAVTALIAVA